MPISGSRGFVGALAALSFMAGTPEVQAAPADSASRAQLPLARSLAKEAASIVALQAPRLAPVDPAERPTRLQDYVVRGRVAACLKGRLRPPSEVAYRLTAEAPPLRLGADHIAFLRLGAEGWVAVEGPIFQDTPSLRRGVLRITGGCGR